MPLDKTNGEKLGELGKGRISANARWRDTSFFEEAAKHAQQVFFEAGALLPVNFEDDDVLIQEYDKDARLVFLFCKKVKGKEMLYPFTFNLSPALIQELRMANRWGYVQ